MSDDLVIDVEALRQAGRALAASFDVSMRHLEKAMSATEQSLSEIVKPLRMGIVRSALLFTDFELLPSSQTPGDFRNPIKDREWREQRNPRIAFEDDSWRVPYE